MVQMQNSNYIFIDSYCMNRHKSLSFNLILFPSLPLSSSDTRSLKPSSAWANVPRKCGLFGVSCEGMQKQVNFLIEGEQVISYMHHFFSNFGVGETCGSSLWQLQWAKQKQLHALVRCLAGWTQASRRNWSPLEPLPYRWPHHIFPWLWLWTNQASIHEDQSQHFGRHGWG